MCPSGNISHHPLLLPWLQWPPPNKEFIWRLPKVFFKRSTHKVPWDFFRVSSDVLNDWWIWWLRGNWWASKHGKNIYNFEVITVPADGLAPLGARPSAGTVMTKFGSCIHGTDSPRINMEEIVWSHSIEIFCHIYGLFYHAYLYFIWVKHREVQMNKLIYIITVIMQLKLILSTFMTSLFTLSARIGCIYIDVNPSITLYTMFFLLFVKWYLPYYVYGWIICIK